MELRVLVDCETNREYLQYRRLGTDNWITVPRVLGATPSDAQPPRYDPIIEDLV